MYSRKGAAGTDHKETSTYNDDYGHLRLVGPLNLNMHTKKADIVTGAELSLDENEFKALSMLAEREGETIATEVLCAKVWNTGNGFGSREAAINILNSLVRKLNEAGSGFIWIEHKPETGYTLRKRWGDDWRKEKTETELHDGEEKLQEKPGTRRIKGIVVSLAACAAAALLAVLLGSFSQKEYIVSEDEQVPLAGAEMIIPVSD
ncbi:MAG: winged helix-turn-helix domain-containing protein [Oscillospiraceae bacterium]|nr:winged helix-turn-helix domain-containing protein [Oscillospiraceae bacterium]